MSAFSVSFGSGFTPGSDNQSTTAISAPNGSSGGSGWDVLGQLLKQAAGAYQSRLAVDAQSDYYKAQLALYNAQGTMAQRGYLGIYPGGAIPQLQPIITTQPNPNGPGQIVVNPGGGVSGGGTSIDPKLILIVAALIVAVLIFKG